MGFLDDFFDPDQFQESGGLLGRLSSLPQGLFASSQPVVSQTPLDATSAARGAAAFDPTQSFAASSDSPPPSVDSNVSQPSPLSFDLGAHLNAGFQKWAQTPVGNPFAALANGIAGFNAVQPTDAAFIGPPAPPPAQTPDFGDRLGAAFQSWAQTPVGSPFAALANGITGFNTGQTSVAPAVSPPMATRMPSDASDQSSPGAQNPANAPFANLAPLWPPRRPPIPRRWPG